MLYFITPSFTLYLSVAMNTVSITLLLNQFIMVQIPFSHGIIATRGPKLFQRVVIGGHMVAIGGNLLAKEGYMVS